MTRNETSVRNEEDGKICTCNYSTVHGEEKISAKNSVIVEK